MDRLRTTFYALLIGVGHYRHADIPPLPAVENDVATLADVLTRHCGYEAKNTIIAVDQQATCDELRSHFARLAQSGADQSTLLVYFSGHGVRALDPQGRWHSFFCPYEADLYNLERTALSNEELSNLLATIRSRRVVVFLDTCHAGAVVTLKAAIASPLRFGLTDEDYAALSHGSGRVVIASSQGSEFSYVRPDGRLSLFTDHLCQGLRGKAALRGNGMVHILDLFHYVNEAVTERNRAQTPILKVQDLDLNFAIAAGLPVRNEQTPDTVGETDAVLARIRDRIILEPGAGAAELSDLLRTRSAWATKRNEVDLKRQEVERLDAEMRLFGPSDNDRALRNRAIYFLLRTCSELTASTHEQ